VKGRLCGMGKLYDAEKIAEFFTNGEKWKDAQDEITLMHMNSRTQTVLMDRIVKEIVALAEVKFGAVSIIDVGCGTAMLLDYLAEAKMLHRVVEYTGYDIVEKFLAIALERADKYRIKTDFRLEDFFAEDTTVKMADVVIASQCMNTIFSEDQYGFIDMSVRKLWACTKGIVIFDLKDEQAPHIHPNRLYFDPLKVYEICRGVTQNVSITQMTKANFTFVLSREELF